MHLGQRSDHLLNAWEPAWSQTGKLVVLELPHQLWQMGSRREQEASLADVNGAKGAGPGKDPFQPEPVKPDYIVSRESVIAVETCRGFFHQTLEPLLFNVFQCFLGLDAEQVAQNRAV